VGANVRHQPAPHAEQIEDVVEGAAAGHGLNMPAHPNEHQRGRLSDKKMPFQSICRLDHPT
jgi:hypothetical protein